MEYLTLAKKKTKEDFMEWLKQQKEEKRRQEELKEVFIDEELEDIGIS